MLDTLRGFLQKRVLAGLVSAGVLIAAPFALAAIISGNSTSSISAHVTYTQLTLNTPSGSQGDLMLASIAVIDGSSDNVTPPSGWTQVARTDNDVNVTLISFWKVDNGQEPTSYTWTIDKQTRAVGGITRYSGVDPNNPIVAVAGNTGFSPTATTTAITTSAANEEVVSLFATNVGKSFSTPSGMTAKYNQQFNNIAPSMAAFDTLQVSAGSTGSVVSTIDAHQARYWSSQQIALRKHTTPPSINGSVSTLDLSSINYNGTTTARFSHTVNAGSNQMLVVTAGLGDTGIDTSATYDGIPMTLGTAHGLGTEEYYDYWYLLSPPQGQHDVVITVPVGGSSTQARQYAAITFDNVDQTTPFDSDGHVGGHGGNPSISVTTTEPDELILYFLDYDDRSTNLIYTPNDPSLYWVNNDSIDATLGNQGAAHVQTTPGTVNVGGTATGNGPWDLIAVPIRSAN